MEHKHCQDFCWGYTLFSSEILTTLFCRQSTHYAKYYLFLPSMGVGEAHLPAGGAITTYPQNKAQNLFSCPGGALALMKYG